MARFTARLSKPAALLGYLFGLFYVAAALTIQSGNVTAFEGPQQAAIESDSKAEIRRLEAYLNNVRTIRSSFVQTASNGHVAEGTLYFARPGKLRIDYLPPVQLQIFGDKTWLIFVDEELKEVNQLPIGATPAALLLKDKIQLSGDVSVQKLTRQKGLIRLHLAQTEEPDAGRLIVAIATDPLLLRGWTVVDAQDIETTVTLIGPTINEKIADWVFLFSRPDWASTELE